MTMQDTWKYGALYVDAALTIDTLEEREAFHDESRYALRAFEESGADFTFDPDWNGLGVGGMYSDGEQLPLVMIGTFGGYPGESLDEANAEAADTWAEESENVMSTNSWFGGCRMVTLWYDLSGMTATYEDALESVERAEAFREYPVLDEELWSEKELKVWDDMIAEMIKDVEDERGELSMEQTEQLWQETYDYRGHWEEGYFPEDEWNEIVDKVLNGEVQLHQDTELENLFTGGAQ